MSIKGQFSDVSIKGNTVNQIIKNGNFVDTTSWLPVGAALSAGNNTLSATGNGATAYTRAYQDTDTPVVVGHKCFVTAKVRVTNANCNQINIALDGSTAGTEVAIASQNAPVSGTWYKLSGIATVGADFTGKVQIKISATYADATTANGKVMEVQEVMAIDLTAHNLDVLTLADCNTRFPNWLSYGTKSTLSIGNTLRTVNL